MGCTASMPVAEPLQQKAPDSYSTEPPAGLIQARHGTPSKKTGTPGHHNVADGNPMIAGGFDRQAAVAPASPLASNPMAPQATPPAPQPAQSHDMQGHQAAPANQDFSSCSIAQLKGYCLERGGDVAGYTEKQDLVDLAIRLASPPAEHAAESRGPPSEQAAGASEPDSDELQPLTGSEELLLPPASSFAPPEAYDHSSAAAPRWSPDMYGLRASLPQPSAQHLHWRHGELNEVYGQGQKGYFHAEEEAIGIDLGTAAAVVGVWRNNRVEIICDKEGRRSHPTYLNFDCQGGSIALGAEAKRRAGRGVGLTVWDVKRLNGAKIDDPAVQEDSKYWPFQLDAGADGQPIICVPVEPNGREELALHPTQCQAMLLRYLRALAECYLEKDVKHAVITVPAYYNKYQRQAIIDAAEVAGLRCLRLVPEPVAAAISYGLKLPERELNVLVFDLGAGTLDVSIVAMEEGIFEVKASAGDNHLGSQDFDNCLVAHFVEEIRRLHGRDISADQRALHRLRVAAERAKCSLSFEYEVAVEADSLQDGFNWKSCLTREGLDSICSGVLRRCELPIERCLRYAKMEKREVEEIVLVGGSTRMPRLRQMLHEMFGMAPLTAIDPDEAVASGAAVQSAILTGKASEVITDILTLEGSTFSLGTEAADGSMVPVIFRNATMPTKKTMKCTVPRNHQSDVVVGVFEGDRAQARDNAYLGYVEMLGLPTDLDESEELDIIVTYDLDGNSILHVSAEAKRRDSSDTRGLKSTTVCKTETARMDIKPPQHAAQIKAMKRAVDALFTEPPQAAPSDAAEQGRAVTVEEGAAAATAALAATPAGAAMPPDPNRGCYFPMYVMSGCDFLALERLLPHEEALAAGLLRRVCRNDGAGDFFYPMVGGVECRRGQLRFVSHRWLAGEEAEPHPDNPANDKLRLLQRLVAGGEDGGATTFVWMDFYSIPQADRATQWLAIASLPFYVHSCGMFTAVRTEEYLRRAWCQTELIVSKLPVRDALWRARDLVSNKTFVDLADGSMSPIPMQVLRNPQACDIKDPADLDGIMPLVHYVEAALADFVAWDRSPDRRFTKRFGGKAAEPTPVDEDPECQRLGLSLADIEAALVQVSSAGRI